VLGMSLEKILLAPIYKCAKNKGHHVMSQTPFVTIKTCGDLNEAHIMKGLLEQSGIPASIEDENFNNVYPIFTASKGVRLKVHEKHVSAAHNLLAEVKNIQPLHPTTDTIDVEECPACGSPDIFKYKSFMGWTIGQSKPNVKGAFRRCVQCDHRWRAGDKKDNMLLVALVLGGVAYVGVSLLLWLIDFIRYL